MTDRLLLETWERGLNQPLTYSNLLLLGLLYPNTSFHDLMSFSIGERDAGLLHLRRTLFGDTFYNTAICPECGEKIEWESMAEAYQLQPLKEELGIQIHEVGINDSKIQFRLPNSEDFMELAEDWPNEKSTDMLLECCLINTDSLDHKTFTKKTKERIIEKMAALDPQADISVQLACPECHHKWTLGFDIQQYLWDEVSEWAYTMLNDIALLAKHLGWSEDDILNMSALRRNMYLKIVQS